GLGAGTSRRPAHRKSYQLGVLATPVQIRTDPLRTWHMPISQVTPPWQGRFSRWPVLIAVREGDQYSSNRAQRASSRKAGRRTCAGEREVAWRNAVSVAVRVVGRSALPSRGSRLERIVFP